MIGPSLSKFLETS